MEQASTRNLFPEVSTEQDWAQELERTNYLLIVAIDDYDTPGIPPLKNCVKDAEDMLEILLEEYEFDAEHVRFLCSGSAERFPHLVNGPATRRFIIDELRLMAQRCKEENQKRAKEEECAANVLLYYSGHGWYDNFLEQGYWIPVDATLDDFSMYVSNSTIRDFLNGMQTHHTLLLADSCFSGSLFATGEGKSVANTRLEQDPSRWGITAGRNEVVSDGVAGQNSPFAANLLEELRKNESIGVQELSVKVLEKVAANDRQTPRGEPLRVRGHKGGQFVFRKRQNARKHFRLGKQLMDLAEHLPERSRYLSAAKQLAMAVRLTKKPEEIAEFSLWHARALAAAGEYTAAVKVAGGPHAEEEHHFLQCCCLFLAYQQGQSELAVQLEAAYKRFAKQWPQSPYLLWCEEMVARIQKPQSVKLGLLLVGIDEYQYVGDLNGCVNDMRLFGDTLSRIWPADSLVVRQIANKEATKANILQAFDEVGSQLGLEDRFIFYYVGHAMKEDDHFIVAHDAKVQAELVEQVIGFSELHEKMLQIPTSAKGLVLDTDGHPQLTQFAQDKQLGYGLYFGSSPGQNAMETQIGGQTHGVFTYSLVEIIQQIEDNEAWERLPMMVTSLVRQRMDNQDPLFFKPGMILSREMRQDIFVDLVEYCEGEVKHIDEARVKSLLNFALKKGLQLELNHLLRLSQYSSSRKLESLLNAYL